MEEEKYFKGIIPPPIIFFALIILGFIAHYIYPFNLVFNKWPLRLFIVFPLFIVSGLIARNALIIMNKYKTAINFNKPTTKFIVEGSFRFTRNPLYLALLLVMVCVAVSANSAWHLIGFIILFVFFNFGIVTKEEQYLENSFGEEYVQYKNKVRRWI